MDKILKWYWTLVKKYKKVDIKKIKLSDCDNWFISSKNIKFKSNLFFKIGGILIKKNKRIINYSWSQPLIFEKRNKGGILGLIKTTIKNKEFYLIQGKFEPGNVYKIQLSPTVQSTFSSIEFNKGKIFYLDYFIKKKFKKNIILKKWVSEDGGRFYNKKNLVMICEIKNYKSLKLRKNFMWINRQDLIKLNFNSKPIVNPHIRTLLSFILS